MAKYNRQGHKLQDINLYPYPNPAMTQILISPRMTAVMTSYLNKVTVSYANLYQAAPYRDPKRQFRQGGHPRGQMLSRTTAYVGVGGAQGDRVIGELSSKTDYSQADEEGRNQYADYQGKHLMRSALYSVLPHRI